MRMTGYVDCDTCVYLASHYCDKCYHNSDIEDYYEEASPEELKQRQRDEQHKMENVLCDRFVKLQLPQNFVEVFSKAKSILENCSYPTYLTIITENKSVLSCDGYILCQLFCDVPEPLKGKKLVRLASNGVYISNNTQTLWDKQMDSVLSLLLGKPEQQHPYNASEIKKEDEDAIFSFVDLDGKPLLLRMRTKYLESTVDILGLEGLSIGIGSRPDHLIPFYFIFENFTGRIVVCPKSASDV